VPISTERLLVTLDQNADTRVVISNLDPGATASTGIRLFSDAGFFAITRNSIANASPFGFVGSTTINGDADVAFVFPPTEAIAFGFTIVPAGTETARFMVSAGVGRFLIGATTPVGTELFRVAGDVQIDGKLTVDGAMDPTSVTLSGGTAQFMQWGDGSTAAVAPAGTGRIRYNLGTNTLQFSNNTGAYANIGSGGVTFPLLATPDGTVAAPSYSWLSDSNTGFFSSAPGMMSASADGVEIMRWDGVFDQVLFQVGGPAPAPAISFLGDADTGVTQLAASPNTVSVVVGGTETFRVTTTGAMVTGAMVVTSEVGLNERVGNPAFVANRGFLYTKDVAGVTELFFERDNGTVLQLT